VWGGGSGAECFGSMIHTRVGIPSVVASIMDWSASTTAKMAKGYGHIGSEVQGAALDALGGRRSLQARRASEQDEDEQSLARS